MKLGDWDLVEPLGRGGMGAVWRAVHPSGAPVAIKVLLPSATDAARDALRAEVRAVASLDHPCIVDVFDQGELEHDVGELRAGSPYLVMELAPDGSLAGRRLPSWPALRAILIDVLAGLAHAHARGLLHRDVKPANVLVRGDRYRLADFGLAHALGRGALEQEVRGTVGYMAPEQLRGELRDQGPATDLYAVGCLAWGLATGAPVFAGDSEQQVDGHLDASPPRFRPRVDVPEGFEGWLRRLLQKAPQDRFLLAADAAWALGQLEGGGSVGGEQTPAELQPASPSATVARAPRGKRARPARLLPARPAPVDEAWQEQARGERLPGIGLGLYRLRRPRFLGRSAERDRLWAALRACAEDSSPRAVALSGPMGSGKSRLLCWLAEHAAERGAAWVLRSDPASGEDLVGSLTRHLGAEGLEGQLLSEHLQERIVDLDEGDLRALCSILDPQGERSQQHRFAAFEQGLRVVGRQRPVVLLLDDSWRSPSELQLAAWLLRPGADRPAPALVLAGCRSEETASAAVEGWDELLERAGCDALALRPFGEQESADLVQALLGLTGPLAKHVRERTDGNPLFAVQVVGDWVDRGLLSPGPSGFELSSSEIPEIPDSLHRLWHDQLGRLLPAVGRRRALEVAAILGPGASRAEWVAVCQSQALPEPGAWLEPVLRAGLGRWVHGSWAFGSGLLREALERAARDEGRARELHRACATALGDGLPQAERRGRHLLAAGQGEDAVEPLLLGARRRRDRSEYLAALELLDLRDGVVQADGDRLVGWLLRCRCLRAVSRHAEAGELAEQAEDLARRLDRPDLAIDALEDLAVACVAQSRAERGLQVSRRGLDEALAAGDPRRAARLRVRLAIFLYQQGAFAEAEAEAQQAAEDAAAHGELLPAAMALSFQASAVRDQGRLPEAGELYEQARAANEALDNPHGQADALLGLGTVHMHTGELDRARRELARGQALYRQVGDGIGVGATRNSLAEVDRHLGRWDAAEQGYREAIAANERADSWNCVPYLNLCLVLIGRDGFEEARVALLALAEAVIEREQRGWLAVIEVLLLPCVLPDLSTFAAHLERATELLERTGFFEQDLLWALERGLERAVQLELAASADSLRALALAQAIGLRDREAQDRLSC